MKMARRVWISHTLLRLVAAHPQFADDNTLQRRALPEHLQGQGTVSYPYTFLYDIAHNKLDVAPKHLHINA
jgi:hypothetical protein